MRPARLTLGLLAGVLGAGPALAAELPTAGVEEVIVTATRRETRLQETPAAIAALYGQSLELRGVVEVGDLGSLVPGLTVLNGGPSNLRLAIRGVQGVGEATVGLYYDEAPVSGMVGASNDAGGSAPGLVLFDVDRLEVLRGPQGTLYGANAMAGAVKVLFRKPQAIFDASGQADVFIRSHGEAGERLAAMVNVPVARDRLALRLAVFQEAGGGYVDNVARRVRDVNDARLWGGRLLARWTPTDALTLDAAAYLQDSRGDLPQWVRELGAYRDNAMSRRTSHDRISILSLTGRWDLGDAVATAVATSSHRRLLQFNTDPSRFFATFLDNPAACARLRGGACAPATKAAFNTYVASFIPNVIQPRQDADTETVELRVTSAATAPFAWTAGVFHSAREGDVGNLQLDVDPASGLVIAGRPPRFARLVHEELRQTAVFADLGWQPTSRLRLEGGVRRFRYARQSAGQTLVGLDLIAAPPTAFQAYASHETGWVSRANISYRLSPATLLYVQVGKGYRPGGVNQVLGLSDALVPYRADHLWTYEAGAKFQLLDGRLNANLAAFLTDWRDMQVLGARPDGLFRFTSNAGSARIVGAEVDLQARPLAELTLEAGLGYADAELSEDQVNAVVVAAGRKGDRIPYVPRVTAEVSVQYERSLTPRLSGWLRAGLAYAGASYSEFRPGSPFYRRLPRSLMGSLRAGVDGDGGRWSAFVYVDNLFDEVGISAATANPATLGETQVSGAAPRTVGIGLRRRL